MEILLGRVLGAHGVHGWIRVRFTGDGPEHLLAAGCVTLSEDEQGTGGRKFEVEGGGTGRTGEARLKLEGVKDREAAQALRGQWVLADEAGLAALPDGEFYWYQLVGCRVETEDGVPVGMVQELWETGAHDVLVIRSEDGRQVLVPTAKELLPQIDLKAKRLVVAGIPGLIEPANPKGARTPGTERK